MTTIYLLNQDRISDSVISNRTRGALGVSVSATRQNLLRKGSVSLEIVRQAILGSEPPLDDSEPPLDGLELEIASSSRSPDVIRRPPCTYLAITPQLRLEGFKIKSV